MAAAAAAVHPSPPALARRTVAWLVCTHLAWAAVDTVIALFIASMWLFFWGQATMGIGRLACGVDCAVVTAAYKVVSVALGVSLLLFFPFTGLVSVAAAAAATDIEATKESAPKTWYAALQDMLRDSLGLALLASWAFSLLMPIGVLVKGDTPVMGSHRERMGSVIGDAGALGAVMVNCVVSCPIVTVRIWRTWRMARAWRKARHAL